MRSAVTLVLMAALLTGCSSFREDRQTFDGQVYRGKAKKADDDRKDFIAEISPVSASLNGAREAGRYEGTRYCIENFGTSRIRWAVGPDTDPAQLVVQNDRLTFLGRCTP